MHRHLWSPSYFAAPCGGAPLAIIHQYTEQQNVRCDLQVTAVLRCIHPRPEGRGPLQESR
ncbi:transposase [Streptomyces sp. FIT100]|uniref:transposase n=1 Tax=Streptomyces sp. FIT100 TaxID=2837956 RepID=UPI0021C89761